jgi:DNA-binding transcriptional LysR family regulator
MQIKALETHLGTALLERNRRTVRLTPAGAVFLPDAKALVQQITDVELRVARISSGNIGHLRIGYVASAMFQLIPSIVLTFQKHYPQVSLDLKFMSTIEQVASLRNETLDAGIVAMPLKEEGVEVTLIQSEPYAIVIPKNHRLARIKSLSVEHLRDEGFIVYGKRWSSSLYDAQSLLCRKAGFLPQIVQETGDIGSVLTLVAAGLGVSILPVNISLRFRDVLKVKVLSQEKLRCEYGIATLASRRTPLLLHLVTTAQRVGRR